MTGGHELLARILIWAAMMAAMMLPSALPTLSVFHQVSRRHQPQRIGVSLLFASAYGSVWLLFSVLLAWSQWQLGQLHTLISMSWLTVLLFLFAGLYQFSSLKRHCLKVCRSPFGFLLTDWRPGYVGAGWMGMRFGFFCLGCCWALMLVMLGVGVMTLVGMLVITVMLTVEKLLPVSSATLAKVNGSLLLLWAGLLFVRQIQGG